jgi:flagellar assembly protein FliH
MGLIKKDEIEEKGTLFLEKKGAPPPKKKAEIRPVVPKGPLTEEKMVKVKSEAQRIIDEAMKQAEAIREEGREAGLEEGRAEIASRIEEAMVTLNKALKDRKAIIKDAEQEVLRLALKVAEQIIRSEVSLHRDVCLNIVAEAIARVSDREQIIIKANREDVEYLKRYKDRLTGMLDGVKSFAILEDSAVEPGGCVIETNLGFIDAKISTKLKSIDGLLKKISSEEES